MGHGMKEKYSPQRLCKKTSGITPEVAVERRPTLREKLYDHRQFLGLLAVGAVGVWWQMYGSDWE